MTMIEKRQKNSKIKNNELIRLTEPLKRIVAGNELFSAINTLGFTRTYTDNQAFLLSNCSEWMQKSFSHGTHKILPGYDYFEAQDKRFVWCDDFNYLQDRAIAMAVAKQFMDIETTLIVNLKTAQYADRFVFSDQKKRRILLGSLISGPGFLDNIIKCFYQQANPILEKAQKYRYKVENPLVKHKTPDRNKVPAEAINAYLSVVLNYKVALSEREYIFLINSFCGIKPGEIAQKFCLSSRTVQNAIQLAKNKLYCSSTTQIFLLFSRTGVFNLYIQPILDDIVII